MKIISVLLIVVLSLPAYAKSSLWQISKGDDYLYIGGTVHILSYKDYPLPTVYEEAYNNSKIVVLETDMKKMQSPEIKAKLVKQLKYSDGSTLKEHIKPATYKALEEYLEPLRIPIVTFEDFKPGMVSMMLTMMELKRLGISGVGVDLFYNSKAMEDHKSLGSLEPIEKQISFLEEMGKDDPDEFILYTLRDIKKLKETFASLKQAWRSGDMDKMVEVALKPLMKFPDTYQSLIVKRNKNWVPQIEAMLKTKDVEMVLVGALHLAGEDSVIQQLKDLGYKVEQF